MGRVGFDLISMGTGSLSRGLLEGIAAGKKKTYKNQLNIVSSEEKKAEKKRQKKNDYSKHTSPSDSTWNAAVSTVTSYHLCASCRDLVHCIMQV